MMLYSKLRVPLYMSMEKVSDAIQVNRGDLTRSASRTKTVGQKLSHATTTRAIKERS